MALQVGIDPTKSMMTRTLTFRLPLSLDATLRKIAEKEERSLNYIIVRALNEHVAKPARKGRRTK